MTNLKQWLKAIVAAVGASLLIVGSVQALSTLAPNQGGTGIGSATTTDIGKVLTVSSTNPFTYKFSIPSSGSGTATSTANYFSVYNSATTTTGTPLVQLDANGVSLVNGAVGTVAVGTSSQADDTFAVQTNGTKLIFDAYDDSGNSVFHVGNSGLVSMSTGIDSGFWHGTIIDPLYGGTGQDSSGWTGIATVKNGTWSATSTLATTTISTLTVTGTSTLTGNVGIGAAPTASSLSVKGSSSLATVSASNSLTADGTFNTGTGWTTTTGWVVGSGFATHTASNLGTLNGTSNATLTNVVYQVNFTVALVGGGGQGFTVTLGGQDSGYLFYVGGAKTIYIKPVNGSGTLSFIPASPGNFDGTIANVTIYAVNPSTADATIISSDGTGSNLDLRTGGSSLKNIFLGTTAGANNVSGIQNVGIGYNVLNSNTTGGDNIGIGYGTLAANTQEGYLLAIGFNALNANTAGTANSAYGYETLQNNTSGSYSTAIGYQSLYSETTGQQNSALGVGTLQNDTTGSFNTAGGLDSLLNNTTANYNTAFGYYSLKANTTGYNNTGIGDTALLQNVSGYNNTALGVNTLYTNNSGTDNTAIGFNALQLSTSYGNTAVGDGAGYTGAGITTGNSDTFLGFNSQASVNSISNATAIGASAVVGASNSLVLGNNVNVGIGTSTPSQLFTVGNNNQFTVDSSGNIIVKGNATLATTTASQLGVNTSPTASSLSVKGSSSMAVVGSSNVLTADGTFTTSVGWTTSTGWVIGSGVATHSASNLGALNGTSSATLTSVVYQVNFTVAINAGGGQGIAVSLGGTDSGGQFYTAGTKTVYIKPINGSGTLSFTPFSPGNFDGTIHNVTIYALTPSTPDATIIASDGTVSNLELRTGGSAWKNTFIGTGVGANNTTGIQNVGIGYGVLNANVTGGGNVSIGYGTLAANTVGNYSTAVGYNALNANNSGANNAAYGFESLQDNTSGSNNSAFGEATLLNNTTGNVNSAFGQGALQNNISGTGNQAFGNSALQNNTSGSYNSALGYNALPVNISGNYNTAVGEATLKNNLSGSYNTAVGINALYFTTAGDNTALGYGALQDVIGGYGNVAVGESAGLTGVGITTGADDVFIGFQSGASANSLNNAIAIGANAVVGASNSLVLGSGVNVGIGTSTPGYKLQVNGTVAFPNLTTSAGLQTGVLCVDANGQVINDSVACLASARRFKMDIKPLTVGLDELMKLEPVSFKWKPSFNGSFQNNPNYNGTQYSLVADDVQKVDKNLVVVETSGKEKGQVAGLADLNHWVALFVQSIQDVEKQLVTVMFKQNTDEAKIQKLEQTVAQQQKEIDLLLNK